MYSLISNPNNINKNFSTESDSQIKLYAQQPSFICLSGPIITKAGDKIGDKTNLNECIVVFEPTESSGNVSTKRSSPLSFETINQT